MKTEEKIKRLREKQEAFKGGLEKIKEQVGYTFELGVLPYLKRPDISINEKIEAICEYLDIKIVTEPEKIKVIKKEK